MTEPLKGLVGWPSVWRAALVLGVPAAYALLTLIFLELLFDWPTLFSYAAAGIMAVWVFKRAISAVKHYRPELQQVIAFAIDIFAILLITALVSSLGFIVSVFALKLPHLVGYAAAALICYAVFERVVFTVGQYQGSRDLATYAMQVGLVILGAIVGAAGGALVGAAGGFSQWAHLVMVVLGIIVGFAASANIFYYAKSALTKHPLAERSPLDKGDWV